MRILESPLAQRRASETKAVGGGEVLQPGGSRGVKKTAEASRGVYDNPADYAEDLTGRSNNRDNLSTEVCQKPI